MPWCYSWASSYGALQASGLSATHEEYREAKNNAYVMAFVQSGVTPEPRQQEFIAEVQGWEKGRFTEAFTSTEELHDAVTRGVHEFLLLNESVPLNEEQLIERASALLPDGRQHLRSDTGCSNIAGPCQGCAETSRAGSPRPARALQADALTGELAVLTTTAGTRIASAATRWSSPSPRLSRLVRLDESGRLLVTRPAVDLDRGRAGLTSLVEEDVREMIALALRLQRALCSTDRSRQPALARRPDGFALRGGLFAVADARGATGQPERCRFGPGRQGHDASVSHAGGTAASGPGARDVHLGGGPHRPASAGSFVDDRVRANENCFAQRWRRRSATHALDHADRARLRTGRPRPSASEPVTTQLLLLPADPESATVDLDTKLIEWLTGHQVVLIDDLGVRMASSPNIRRTAHALALADGHETTWHSYFAVHRSGALELGMGDIGGWETRNNLDDPVRVISLAPVVARTWAMLILAADLAARHS